MSNKKKRISTSMADLTLQDVICPICLSILIKPVTMPCTHSLCMSCFEQHVSETSLACPICRMRISVWVRRNSKSKRLINNRLWQMIQDKFSAKVEARLQGIDDLDDEDFTIPNPSVCAPGEIRQEYEALVAIEQKQLASRRSQEEEASSTLILKLQEDEKMKLRQRRAQLQDLAKEDEVMAQHIEKEEMAKKKLVPKAVATSPKGPMDIYIGQKTPRSHGKQPLPGMSSQRTSSPTPDSQSLSSSTPTASVSTNGRSSSKLDFECLGSFSGTFSGNVGSKLGRQLREITSSSQSSESESEDQIPSADVRRKRGNTSGKENMENSAKDSHRKYASTCHKRLNGRKKSPQKNSLLLGNRTNSEVDDKSEATDNKSEVTDESDLDNDPDFKLSNYYSDVSKRNKTQAKCSPSRVENENSEVEIQECSLHDYNSSIDYALLCDTEEIDAETLEKIKEEQLRVEERLKQEQRDRMLALDLQKQLEQEMRQVDRSRGSEDEYGLRNRSGLPKASTSCCRSPAEKRKKTAMLAFNSPTEKRKRQTTLIETMAKRHKS